MCSVVLWRVDMMPDMLTHYHTHSSHSRKVLHKECKITISNNGMWRDLYLSCSDIYFRREFYQYYSFADTNTYTYTKGSISYFWSEQSNLFSLCDVLALLQFQGLSHIENPAQTGQHLVSSMIG